MQGRALPSRCPRKGSAALDIRQLRKPAGGQGRLHLPGNKKSDREDVLKAHSVATIRRMEGHTPVFAVQDTTSVNYNSQKEYAGYEIKRPQIKNKALLPSLKVNAVYTREETPPEGTGRQSGFS